RRFANPIQAREHASCTTSSASAPLWSRREARLTSRPRCGCTSAWKRASRSEECWVRYTESRVGSLAPALVASLDPLCTIVADGTTGGNIPRLPLVAPRSLLAVGCWLLAKMRLAADFGRSGLRRPPGWPGPRESGGLSP